MDELAAFPNACLGPPAYAILACRDDVPVSRKTTRRAARTEEHMAGKVRMTRGKFEGIQAVADENGIIAAAAMDQRGSLQKAIGKAKGSDVGAAELGEFKTIVTRELTPYASAILMDPEYGLDAIKARAEGVGVLLAYEKTGYDADKSGRLPDL